MYLKKVPTGKDIIAHHEAGHAIAAIYNGIRFEYVTIDTNDEILGQVVFDPEVFEYELESNWFFIRNACVVAAGPVADRRYRKITEQEIPLGVSTGWEQDELNTEELLCIERDNTVKDALLDYVNAKTEWLINEKWTEVETVAKGLLERQKLTKDEVFKISFGVAMDKLAKEKNV